MFPLLGAVVCFGSFAWGMARHFRRVGSPTRFMMITAVLALGSAALHIAGLLGNAGGAPTAGAVLYGLSAAIFWAAVRVTRGKLAACGQGQISSSLVMSGPYRYVRHPFYTSYNLAWLAGFVATAWWPLAATTALMAILYHVSAREEERGFRKGDLALAYQVYSKQAGRYLPKLRIVRTKPDPSGRLAA